MDRIVHEDAAQVEMHVKRLTRIIEDVRRRLSQDGRFQALQAVRGINIEAHNRVLSSDALRIETSSEHFDPGQRQFRQCDRTNTATTFDSVEEQAMSSFLPADRDRPCSDSMLWSIAAQAVRNGRLCVTLGELSDAGVDHGMRVAATITELRMLWNKGLLQLYGAVPSVFIRDYFESLESIIEAATCYCSPRFGRVSWPLLRGVLLSFRQAEVRPSLALVLETCRCSLMPTCVLSDIIIALAGAPPDEVQVVVAPWKHPSSRVVSNSLSLDRDIELTLERALLVWHPSGAAEDRSSRNVFPTYSPEFASIIEAESFGKSADTFFSGVEEILQEVLPSVLSVGEILTLPMLFALAPIIRDRSRMNISVGALLWTLEKVEVQRSADAATNNDQQLESGADEAATMASSSIMASQTLSSLLAVEMDGEIIEDARNEKLSALEALVLCFHKDILQNQRIFLGQLNNSFKARSNGMELDYGASGFSRLRDFLAIVPGIEVSGVGKTLTLQLCDEAVFTALVKHVFTSVNQRIAARRQRGLDTSELEIEFQLPRDVPLKILDRIWKLFWSAPDFRIHAAIFLRSYNQTYFPDKLRFKGLGDSDVRGLLARVPFLEKIGGRQTTYYTFCDDALLIGSRLGCKMSIARRRLQAENLKSLSGRRCAVTQDGSCDAAALQDNSGSNCYEEP